MVNPEWLTLLFYHGVLCLSVGEQDINERVLQTVKQERIKVHTEQPSKIITLSYIPFVCFICSSMSICFSGVSGASVSAVQCSCGEIWPERVQASTQAVHSHPGCTLCSRRGQDQTESRVRLTQRWTINLYLLFSFYFLYTFAKLFFFIRLCITPTDKAFRDTDESYTSHISANENQVIGMDSW